MTRKPRGRISGRVGPVATGAIAGIALMATGTATAATLTEAVQQAIDSNPEIAEASAGREVVDHELRQARGLYLPQIDIEAFGGTEWTDSAATRARGFVDGRELYPNQLSIVLQQMIFDGFGTDNEVERQASLVDAAAHRVYERAELIGLDVVQTYLDVMRQMELLGLARDNVAVHQRTLGNVRRRQSAGRSSIADVHQATERLRAAEATVVEVERSFENARIAYQRLVGEPAGEMRAPRPVVADVPINVDVLVTDARRSSPVLLSARADLDGAEAAFRAAAAPFYPSVTLESRATFGEDIGGIEGTDDSYDVLLVARYNLYRGGIDAANREEQLSRTRQLRSRLLSLERDVEELARQSWNEMQTAARRQELLQQQVLASERVRDSYRQQFNIGQRTLLDLLDSEAELFRSLSSRTSVDYALIFARYRVIAASGNLLRTLGVDQPPAATANARRGAGVPPTPNVSR